MSNGPYEALAQVFSRYLEILNERLNQAPDRNKLAFLDMLGASLLPAKPARAPVVFDAISGVSDSRVPARTRVGAMAPGRNEPIVFETEHAIALVSARLREVFTVWPGQDAYSDHTVNDLSGRPFTLFDDLRPIPHELYLAHGVHFGLAGKAIVEVQFEFSALCSVALPLAWEYWDGEIWQAFKPFKEFSKASPEDVSVDGANGLTRSGTVRLVTDCATTAKTKVNGIESYWIRGRVTEPMPDRPDRVLQRVDRISVMSRMESASASEVTGHSAFNDGLKLDTSKAFRPFGYQPQAGGCFYISCDAAFSKPGAMITLTAKAVSEFEHSHNPPADPATGIPQSENASFGQPVGIIAEAWNGEVWEAVKDPSIEWSKWFDAKPGSITFKLPDAAIRSGQRL